MVTFGFVHATAASQEATDMYFGVGEHMLHCTGLQLFVATDTNQKYSPEG